MNTGYLRDAKKTAARALSVFLAFTLVLFMCVKILPKAQADETPKYKTTVTVKGVTEGDTVTAFTIATAKVGDDNNLEYDMASGLPEKYDTIEELAAITSDGYSYTKNTTDMQIAAGAIAASISSGAGAASAVAGEDGKAVLEDLPAGYYLLMATGTGGATMVYQNMVVDISPVPYTETTYTSHDPVEIDVKKTDVSIDKKALIAEGVYEDITYNYSVGDEVPFKITSAVPDYPKDATSATLTFTDTPATGLSLDEKSVAIKINDTDYTESFTITGGGASAMTITWKGTLVDLLALQNCPVIVTYNGIVTSDAFSTATQVTENSATLTFNPNPYREGTATTIPTIVKVKTFGVVFKKVDEDKNPLQYATFTLCDKDGKEIKDEKGTVITCTSDSNGYVYFSGRAEGTYILKETTVPSGKVKANDVLVTLSKETCTADNPATTGVTENNFLDMTQDPNDYVVDPNQPVLPVTGDAGTLALTLGGLALIVAAVVVLHRNRKQNTK